MSTNVALNIEDIGVTAVITSPNPDAVTVPYRMVGRNTVDILKNKTITDPSNIVSTSVSSYTPANPSAWKSIPNNVATALDLLVGGASNNVAISVDNNVTATPSGNQSTSYLINKFYTNVVTIASNGDAVRLPTGAIGSEYFIKNAGGHYLSVYPATGDSINGFSTNAAVTIPATSLARFVFANNWQMYCDNRVDVTQFPGSTADVMINAAVASLPPTGGIIDCRAFGASTQTIAATVNLGASNGAATIFEFSPATSFIPSTNSVDMFWLKPSAQCENLSCDVTSVSGYSGNVMKLVTANYDNQPGNWTYSRAETALRKFTIFGGGNTTGTGIYCAATSGTQYIQFMTFTDIAITGLQYGILAVCSNNGWFNSNNFVNIRLINNVYAVKFDTTATIIPVPCAGNNFFGLHYEYSTNFSSVGVYVVWLHGPSIIYNSWYGARFWDMPSGGGRLQVYIDDALSINNKFEGQVNTAMITDASNTVKVEDLNGGNCIGNLFNTNGILKFNDIRLTNPTSGYRFNNSIILWGDGNNTVVEPQSASGNVILRSNNDANSAVFDTAGNLTCPHFNVATANQTTAYKVNGTTILSTNGTNTTISAQDSTSGNVVLTSNSNNATFDTAGNLTCPHFNVATANQATAYKINGITCLSGDGSNTIVTPEDAAAGSVFLQTNSRTQSASLSTAGVWRAPIVNSDTGYRFNGISGVTAGPFTTITSITVKGGIITAISGS